jgi:hypothetical protein
LEQGKQTRGLLSLVVYRRLVASEPTMEFGLGRKDYSETAKEFAKKQSASVGPE